MPLTWPKVPAGKIKCQDLYWRPKVTRAVPEACLEAKTQGALELVVALQDVRRPADVPEGAEKGK